MSAAEIHCELCMAYGQNVMNEQWQYCRMFKDEWGKQMFMMNSEVISHL
jgi:hypothetical protein